MLVEGAGEDKSGFASGVVDDLVNVDDQFVPVGVSLSADGSTSVGEPELSLPHLLAVQLDVEPFVIPRVDLPELDLHSQLLVAGQLPHLSRSSLSSQDSESSHQVGATAVADRFSVDVVSQFPPGESREPLLPEFLFDHDEVIKGLALSVLHRVVSFTF